MKIIKKGIKPSEQIYTGECRQCGTVVEFKRSEARYVSDQRDGDAVVIACPVCSHEIWVDAGLTQTDR